MSRDGGYDRFLTIFSPEGRLYQIEYAMKAVTNCGITGVAVRGVDSVVVACQKKVPDRMIDPASVTRLFNITPNVGALVVGKIADGRSAISRARQEAAEFEYKNGYPMPASVLARRLADIGQLNTQYAGRRTMGTDIVIVSIDDEMGPQVFLIDPAGHCDGYKAVASGALAQEANSTLERKITENKNMNYDQTVRAAIMTLQSAVGSDFKKDELEVGVITLADVKPEEEAPPKFRQLSNEDIENHLVAIAERD